MAKKTNCTINGRKYYKISRKVGMKLNKNGIWVDDRKTFYGASKSEAEEKYDTYMKQISAGKEISKNRLLTVIINDESSISVKHGTPPRLSFTLMITGDEERL